MCQDDGSLAAIQPHVYIGAVMQQQAASRDMGWATGGSRTCLWIWTARRLLHHRLRCHQHDLVRPPSHPSRSISAGSILMMRRYAALPALAWRGV